MQGNLQEILLKMGRDQALPGVDLAIELLQELRADLLGAAKKSARDFIDGTVVVEPKRLGRPPKIAVEPGETRRNSGWPADPEARRREMRRRLKVARERKRKATLRGDAPKEDMRGKTPNHPRNPEHPGHAAWVEKLKIAQRKSYQRRAAEAAA